MDPPQKCSESVLRRGGSCSRLPAGHLPLTRQVWHIPYNLGLRCDFGVGLWFWGDNVFALYYCYITTFCILYLNQASAQSTGFLDVLERVEGSSALTFGSAHQPGSLMQPLPVVHQVGVSLKGGWVGNRSRGGSTMWVAFVFP